MGISQNNIKFNRDQEGVHIHIPHSHFYIFVGIISLVLIVIASIFAYRYYLANYYDSSTNKKELQDLTPIQPPADIKKQLQEINTTEKKEEKKQQVIVTPPVASISAIIKVPVLMYHYVEYVQNKNDTTRISLNTTPYTLENEIQALIAAKYTFITMNELADVLDGKTNLPPNPIVMTFDDGYRDFATDAYPILKKYNTKATEYVISGFLNRPNHMLVSQVQQIANEGLVEIGAHTVDHAWLKGLSLKNASTEIFQSRIMLEELINKPVLSFAYPFGAFDDQSISLTKDSGFRTAVSTLPGVEASQANRFFLYRLRPGGRQGQYFITWLKAQTTTPL